MSSSNLYKKVSSLLKSITETGGKRVSTYFDRKCVLPVESDQFRKAFKVKLRLQTYSWIVVHRIMLENRLRMKEIRPSESLSAILLRRRLLLGYRSFQLTHAGQYSEKSDPQVKAQLVRINTGLVWALYDWEHEGKTLTQIIIQDMDLLSDTLAPLRQSAQLSEDDLKRVKLAEKYIETNMAKLRLTSVSDLQNEQFEFDMCK